MENKPFNLKTIGKSSLIASILIEGIAEECYLHVEGYNFHYLHKSYRPDKA